MKMFPVAVVLLCVSILLSGVAFAQDAKALVDQAEKLWLTRSVSEKNVLEANKLLEQAAAADPTNEAAFVNQARNYQFLGRFAPAAQKDAIFQKGVEAAKKALALNPSGAGGNYWYVACLAKSLEGKGVTTKMKYVGDIKAHMATAIKSDPKYYYGGPYRVSGMLNFKSPVGSNKTAIEELKKSLTYAPDYSLTLVNLGEVLIKEKQFDEAKTVLEKTLALSAKPGFERELADDKELAKKLLVSIPK